MAGPNLTGWTANSLTPVAKQLNGGAPAGMMKFTPQPGLRNNLTSMEVVAKTALTKAQATNSPEDWQHAYAVEMNAETLRNQLAQLKKPASEQGFIESYGARRQRVAKDFETKYPGSKPDVAALEERLAASVARAVKFQATDIFGRPSPLANPESPGGWWTDDPARIAGLTGGGAGGGAAVDSSGNPVPAPEVRSDVIGGLAPDYGAQVEGAAGGPSFSGPTSGWTQAPGAETPTAAFSPPTVPQAPLGSGSSSPTDAYNLTPEELGSAGPDPRLSATPTTPLEQLLRTIYPDAPVSAGADPRSAGASNGFAEVLAYINSQGGSGSGYVPAPALFAPAGVPSAGANIASTIPGAPSWLGPQINNLSGGGGGFVQAPPSGGGGMNLAGLAAISAEQRVQQAQLDAALAKQQADYFAQQNTERELAARRAQAERQRGNVAGSGWNQPLYKDGKFFAGELPY